jgi:hypothetical protein
VKVDLSNIDPKAVEIYISSAVGLFKLLKVEMTALISFLRGQATTEDDDARIDQLEAAYDAAIAKEQAIADQGAGT